MGELDYEKSAGGAAVNRSESMSIVYGKDVSSPYQ